MAGTNLDPLFSAVLLPTGYVYAGVGEIIGDTFKYATILTLTNGRGFLDVVTNDPNWIGAEISPEMLKHTLFVKPRFYETKEIDWGNSTPEPTPLVNEYPGIQELVIKDLQDRLAFGVEKYGGPLRPYDGRRTLKEIYQERLDELIYWRKLMYEVYGE